MLRTQTSIHLPTPIMFSRYSFLTCLIAGLVLSQPCLAQNGGDVRLSFVTFPKSEEPVKLQLFLGEGKLLDIEAPSNWLSPAVRVAPMETWLVGTTLNGPDGKPAFKELGRAISPASPDQILLLVRKGKEITAGFDIVALNSRADGFGDGKYLFMNAAKVDVAGVVGEERLMIKPSQHQIIKPKIAAGKHTFHVALYHRKGDEAKSFFSTAWRVGENERNFIFFYHDPQTTHIRLHAIKDYIP